MALGGIWSRLTGGIAGLGVGFAARDAIEPVLEVEKQQAWARRAVRTLAPATAAQADAKGVAGNVNARDDAKRAGIGDARYDTLVRLAYTFPGLAELDDLTNREIISAAQADAALTRLGYPEPWRARLIELFQDKLSPATVANAVQQGHMPNDGILPSIDPTISYPPGYRQPAAPDDAPPSSVPLTTIPLDPIREAAAAGIDLERLKVEANLSGLPPGPEALLAMWNRNLIDQDAVDAGIREGHMKTKWAHAFKRMRWAVLGGAEYAGLWLRGWITKAEAIEGGALTGHTPEQMELLYKNRGRPMAPVQAYTAWARGAPHPVGEGLPDRPGTFDFEDFKTAIQRSDIRTEYVAPLWHNRWAYPSLFQLGRLATAGALSEDRVRVILKYLRYEPQDIESLADFWYRGATTAVDPAVRASKTAALTRIRNAYVQRRADEAQVQGWLQALDFDQTAIDGLLTVYGVLRAIPGAGLTRSQIRKAYRDEPPLFTRDRAMAELEDLGMLPDEATTYLDE